MSHNSRLSRIHNNMKKRCYNSNCKSYKDYGNRGITVCEEWLNTEKVEHNKNMTRGFSAFKEWALSNGYEDNLTLDRINNNKGYSPDNCRWATVKVQDNNKRNNHYITYRNQTKTLKQWSEELGFNFDKIKARLNVLGWPVEKAFETD